MEGNRDLTSVRVGMVRRDHAAPLPSMSGRRTEQWRTQHHTPSQACGSCNSSLTLRPLPPRTGEVGSRGRPSDPPSGGGHGAPSSWQSPRADEIKPGKATNPAHLPFQGRRAPLTGLIPLLVAEGTGWYPQKSSSRYFPVTLGGRMTIIPILQMRQWRLRRVNGHTAAVSNPSLDPTTAAGRDHGLHASAPSKSPRCCKRLASHRLTRALPLMPAAAWAHRAEPGGTASLSTEFGAN